MTTPGTEEGVCLVSNIAHSTMENDVENKLNNHIKQDEVNDEDEEEEEVWLSSNFEIDYALDLKEEDEGSSFSLTSWQLHA